MEKEFSEFEKAVVAGLLNRGMRINDSDAFRRSMGRAQRAGVSPQDAVDTIAHRVKTEMELSVVYRKV
jgi:hypothetical protein